MLLDRLAALGGTRQSRYHPTTEQDIDALIASVQRNLQRLLTKRCATVSMSPNFNPNSTKSGARTAMSARTKQIEIRRS